jgi:hypothetical protein
VEARPATGGGGERVPGKIVWCEFSI